MIKQRICVLSVCYNEEDMIQFYLDYYINFLKVDKIVIFDGGSTDKTHEIIKEYPKKKIDLIIEKQDGQNDQYLRNIKNNGWKKYRNDYDWIVVCDIDEFLYHPDIHDILQGYKKSNITIPLIKGYDMISLNFPRFKTGTYLPDIVTRGISDNTWMGKKIIFDPDGVDDINYRYGCHDCDPTGVARYSDNADLFLLHYKWMSHNYLTKRCEFLNNRRSKWNIEHKAGEHWMTYSNMSEEKYNEKYKNSVPVLKMKHFYQNIQGWFDFENFYSRMVSKFNSGSHFIEIGAWLGKSTAFMVVEIINSNKDIKFDVIDTWEGSKNFIDEQAYEIDEDPYEIFLNNLSNVKQYINPIKENSNTAYKRYEDDSIDFVFIDAGHDYNSVINDIKNWYPKVKKEGGIIAGHDYYVYPDVKRAVDEFFKETNNIKIDDSLKESCGTWFVEVGKIENNQPSFSFEIDNHIIEPDLEQLKIRQLSELENFMKIDKNLLYINDQKIIRIKNPSKKDGLAKRLIPYLYNKGYKIKEVSEKELILFIEKKDDVYEKPLFSILTPTYNRHKELKRAIESVMNQSFDNFEMIICSDGHDEFVEKMILDYKSPNKLLYYHTNKTNDYGSAQRNLLTKLSSGKFLLYLDDDNYLYPNCLETIYNNIDDNDDGMLIFKIDYDGLSTPLPVDDKIILGKIDTLNIAVNKYYTKNAVWYDYVGHDYEFIKICEYNVILHNKKIKYINDVLGCHTSEISETNNSIVIMTSHPNYSSIENITIESIKSFKNSGKDVILSSHTPLSIDLQKLATYTIYDKNNPLIRHDYFTQSWFDCQEYYALINLTKNDNNFNHALGVYLNYYNGMILAKSLGYKTAICSNFDLIFSNDDISLIDNKIDEMRLKNKKAFFMNTPEQDGVHFKTIFFITDIEWFIKKFAYISNEEIYNKEIKKCGSSTNCLENFVYHSLKNDTDDLLLQEINENDLFKKSRINIFSLIEYSTILPYENDIDNKFVVWFSSSNKLDNRKLFIVIYRNNKFLKTVEQDITREFRFYDILDFNQGDKYEIRFIVKNDISEILKDKSLYVDNDVFNDIKTYGRFLIKY